MGKEIEPHEVKQKSIFMSKVFFRLSKFWHDIEKEGDPVWTEIAKHLSLRDRAKAINFLNPRPRDLKRVPKEDEHHD